MSSQYPISCGIIPPGEVHSPQTGLGCCPSHAGNVFLPTCPALPEPVASPIASLQPTAAMHDAKGTNLDNECLQNRKQPAILRPAQCTRTITS